jgi:uncharacterized protein with von Willebrand factor type A (vWA) domain
VTLYGPTNFTPTLKMAMNYASKSHQNKDYKYYILLILTDGEISDMQETVKNIIEASSLPLRYFN